MDDLVKSTRKSMNPHDLKILKEQEEKSSKKVMYVEMDNDFIINK